MDSYQTIPTKFDPNAVTGLKDLSPQERHKHLPVNAGTYDVRALREMVAPYIQPCNVICSSKVFDYSFRLAAEEVTNPDFSPESIFNTLMKPESISNDLWPNREKTPPPPHVLPEPVLKALCQMAYETIMFDKANFTGQNAGESYRVQLMGKVTAPDRLVAGMPHADIGKGGYERIYLFIPFFPMTQIIKKGLEDKLGIPDLRRRQTPGRTERKNIFDKVLPLIEGFHNAKNSHIVLIDGDLEHRSGPLPPGVLMAQSFMAHITAYPT